MADRSETLTINIVSIPESYQSEGFTCENQDCISETLTITSVNITELIHTTNSLGFQEVRASLREIWNHSYLERGTLNLHPLVALPHLRYTFSAINIKWEGDCQPDVAYFI